MGRSERQSRRPHELPMPEPLAYFLTWPTYGAWLPGDERGWVRYKLGWQPPDPPRKLEAQARMTEAACVLGQGERDVVERTIADHCRIRGWVLHAVNGRSNHVHVVVSAQRDPAEVRDQLKAWCTRRLKELTCQATLTRRPSDGNPAPARSAGEGGSRSETDGGSRIRRKWWAERGSCRWIGDEDSLEAVIRYVLEGQGPG